MDYLSMFLGFLLGWFLGSIVATIKIRQQLFKLLVENAEQEKEKPQVPHLIIEQHGDMLYIFDKESDTFLCQGKSKEELIKNLADYKNIKIAFVEFNSKLLWFVNGEIKDGATANEN